MCQPLKPQLNIKTVCDQLRGKAGVSKFSTVDISLPDSVYDLLHGLLDCNAANRLTAEQALLHEFFSESDDIKSDSQQS